MRIHRGGSVIAGFALIWLFAATAHSQVISTRAGYVSSFEGQVVLPVRATGKPERQLAEGESIATATGGRATLLLTAACSLRLEKHSEARMLSTELTAPVVELLHGSHTLAYGYMQGMARTPVALVWRGYRFAITASGAYRFETSNKSIRVLILPDRRLGDGKLRMPGAAHDLKSGWYQELSVLGDLGPVTKIKPTDLPSSFGYVNYYEGQVGMPMGAGSKPIRQLENGHVMRTGSSGRAELLLTPGGYLRMDNSSALRILSAKTQGAAIELLEGKYLAEIFSSAKQAPSTLVWRAQKFLMSTAGLYRFEAQPGNLRVYVQKGKLRLPGVKNEVKKGGYVDLTASGSTASPAAFDVNKKDDFDRFNAARMKALQPPRRFPRLFPSQPDSQGVIFIPMAAGQL